MNMISIAIRRSSLDSFFISMIAYLFGLYIQRTNNNHDANCHVHYIFNTTKKTLKHASHDHVHYMNNIQQY